MSDLFDYMTWRGDLSFGNAPLCPVDALIFSVLAYMNFEGIVSDDVRADPQRIANVAQAYAKIPRVAGVSVVGAEKRDTLLEVLAGSTRYGGVRMFGARQILNRKAGVQFGAVSFLLPGQNIFVAFEGTDDTLIGWKEDFRMSYECPVPAQLRAVEYLREVAAAYPLRRIFVGGHSKGGNLAMYAAVYAEEGVRARIRAVFNNDGPGFCDGTLSSPVYLEMRDRIHTYLPQSSVVAVLLEHDENYKIVKSNRKGIMQHDAFSWEVLGTEFVYATERTAFGKQTEAIVDRFVEMTSPERRRQFCEALFTILEASEKDTVSGLLGGKRQALRNIWGAYTDLSDEVRVLLNETLAALNESRKDVKRKQKTELLTLPKNEKSS